MAISGDIEKLERRWMENPTGLMFAPLAEAYRKAGDHARALEILAQGLVQHPDYVPALIVRGRCQLDGDAHPEAEAAFQQALDRDPVNPIALRGLAEVFERTGRNDLAIERLEVLLEVDRGDADARADLVRLRELPVTAATSPLVSTTVVALQAPEVEPAVDDDLTGEEPEAAPQVSQWAAWMPGGIKSESEEEGSEPAELESLVGFVTNDSDGPMMDMFMAGKPAEPDESAEDEAVASEPTTETPEPEPAVSKWSSWASWRESNSEAVPAETDDAPKASPEADLVGWAPRAVDPEPIEAELVEDLDLAEDLVEAEPELEVMADADVDPGPSLAVTSWAPASDEAADREADAPAGLSSESESESEPEDGNEIEPEPEADIVAAAEADVEREAEEAEFEPGIEVETEAEAEAEAEVEAESEFEVEAEFEFEAEAEAEDADEAVAEADAVVATEPVAVAEDDEPIAIEELVMEQELIVTESMAEVFLRQGHRDLALAVYRQLVASPEYSHLHETIAVLERAAGMSRDAAAPVPASLPDPVPMAQVVEPARCCTAAETGGVRVATFLREVLDAPPPATDSTVLPPAIERAPAGEPTRDAGHPLSLSDVFGEEPATAALPAIPAEERRVAPTPEAPTQPEPSYDEFFGAIGTEDDMPGAAVSSETEHLEQFNEWLRGLKR